MIRQEFIGAFVVAGDEDRATVRTIGRPLSPSRVLEEFDNSTTTDDQHPSAFERAKQWAKEQT